MSQIQKGIVDGTLSLQTVSRISGRKVTSKCWNLWRTIASSDTRKIVAGYICCDKCQQIKKWISGDPTTKLLRHSCVRDAGLRSTAETSKTYQDTQDSKAISKQEQLSPPAKGNRTKHEKSTILNACMAFTARDMRPLSIVEESEFRHLMDSVLSVSLKRRTLLKAKVFVTVEINAHPTHSDDSCFSEGGKF